MMNRKLVVALLAIGLGAVSLPASAHVTVNPAEAEKGGFAKLTFRVPNERPDSGTTKVEVSFPPAHPLAHINVKPVPGWTFTMERQTLATPIKSEEAGEPDITEYVAKITWEGGTINPGEFQEFEVSGGPLPEDADQMVFKAVQTYASGEVVRWIEEPTSSGTEPEFPAPILTLVAGGESEETTGTTAAEEAQGGATSNGDGGGSDRLGLLALVVAGVALVLSGGAVLRRNPKPSDG